jgi:hypothetical protein
MRAHSAPPHTGVVIEKALAFLLALIQCPACFGFWEGVIAGYIYGGIPTTLPLGFITLTTNLILYRLALGETFNRE